MKPQFITVLAIIAAAFQSGPAVAQEARASVYVVDRSDTYSAQGGAAFKYSPALATGEDREVLAVAKGSPGSTLIMIAFQNDNLFKNLAPVISEQNGGTQPVKFPQDSSETRWTYEPGKEDVELYILALQNDDPQLERLKEYAEWLNDSLANNETEVAMLHALAIKNRISNLHRSSNAEVLTVDFPNVAPIEPTAKATTTRGGPLLGHGAATRSTAEDPKDFKSVKEIDSKWEEDSRPVSFGPSKPGILIFPISTPKSQ